ncbi:hypothetical protein OR573_12040 [Halomonas sp. CH40]
MASAKTLLWVHIGALRDESRALIQQAQADQAVLVASLGQDAASVKALNKSVSACYLAEHPITPQGVEAVLYQYNLPELNSLAPATGLKALYPGLEETQQVALETQPLDAALKAHQLEEASITHLVLEQPESALALLQSLEAQGHLHSLQRLWVRTSEEALYEGMPNQAALQASCAELGFELEDTLADDPDFILLEYTRNPLYTQLKAQQEKADRLEQQRDQLQEAHDKQAAAQDKAQTEIEQLKQNHEKLSQQHAEQSKALEAAHTEVSELKQQRDQLKKAHDEQAAAKEKAQAEVDQLKKARDEQAAAKDKAQAVIDQLKKQRDDQAAAKEKVQAEVAQLKQERDKLNKQQETLRQQHREQQQENQQLREEVKATDERQNKLNIELERAEAQLELIKDLLLKDRLLSND